MLYLIIRKLDWSWSNLKLGDSSSSVPTILRYSEEHQKFYSRFQYLLVIIQRKRQNCYDLNRPAFPNLFYFSIIFYTISQVKNKKTFFPHLLSKRCITTSYTEYYRTSCHTHINMCACILYANINLYEYVNLPTGYSKFMRRTTVKANMFNSTLILSFYAISSEILKMSLNKLQKNTYILHSSNPQTGNVKTVVSCTY